MVNKKLIYKEIEADLIELAKEGEFHVIAHGCNCLCTQKAGIAKSMSEQFGTDEFLSEHKSLKGDFNKLGQIEAQVCHRTNKKTPWQPQMQGIDFSKWLYVVNCYTQFEYGRSKQQLDYEALTLCLRKINHDFKGKNVGLPKIGCNLAGGDWDIVKEIIIKELKDCNITVCIKPYK